MLAEDLGSRIVADIYIPVFHRIFGLIIVPFVLAGVIIIEATPFYFYFRVRKKVQLPYIHSLGVIGIANIISTVCGFSIGFFESRGYLAYESLHGFILLAYLISCAIELPLIYTGFCRILKYKISVVMCIGLTFFVNLLSYLVILAIMYVS